VDVYDALTTARSYKPALSSEHAIRELREEAVRGWKFDAIVEEFATLASHGDLGQLTARDVAVGPPLQRWRTSI
jgi:HD-GYP domain-containing protein (c-di-GMP phosphodiesterase class II)